MILSRVTSAVVIFLAATGISLQQYPSKSGNAIYVDKGGVYDSPGIEDNSASCDGLWIRPLNRTNQSPHRCVCNATHVSCINLQMTPPPPGGQQDPQHVLPDYFMELDESKFENIDTITIHGNNLEKLPERLFGPGDAHKKLKHLNLSSNYFISLNAEAFTEDLKSLETLDLSDNEIILTRKDVGVFQHLPALKELHLRRSFNHYRSDGILPILDKALRTARLNNLEKLVLSGNNFHKIPKHLGCYLPKLRHLKFRWNSVSNWDVVANQTCFSELEILDLSHFSRVTKIDKNFVKFANNLPSDTKIILSSLQLKASPELLDFVSWLNESRSDRQIFTGQTVVRYKNSATQPLKDVLKLPLETFRRQIDNPPAKSCPMVTPTLNIMVLSMTTYLVSVI